MVVTSGILVAEVDSQRHELRTGDSCYFDSRLPHRYLNDQQIPAVFLISITPPSF